MGSPHAVADHAKTVLIFFDGVCNLCNGVVKFLIRRDHKRIFKFASLQSDFARATLRQINVDPYSFDSVVVIDGPLLLTKSDAAMHIAKYLGGGWKVVTALKILPKVLRDAGYNVIASNRYRLFGRQDQCMIPTPEIKERFVG